MCSIDSDDGERAQVWRESVHAAGKPHRCASCGAAIARGEQYTRHFSVFDGTAYSKAVCSPCTDAREAFSAAHGVTPFPSSTEHDLRECASESEPADRARWREMADGIRARRATAMSAGGVFAETEAQERARSVLGARNGGYHD